MNDDPPQIDAPKTTQILVVEDERIIALNLKEALESLGYAVVGIAASGAKAVEKATALRPDLVLMDIQLKGRMDGIEAAEQIWENLQIPTIYVTGHSDTSTLERAKVTAPFGYILKPVKEQELHVAIATALQRYEREQLFSAVLTGMGDGAIVVTPQSRVQFLNRVAESLTGWQLGEARNRELSEVFQLVSEQTQQPVANPVTTVLQQEETVYLEEPMLLITKNGTAIPIGDSAAPVKDNKGAIAGVVVVFRDVTQRRQAEERHLAMERARQLEIQMAELQRLDRLKEDFLSTISHELRTPLSNIQMAVRMLVILLEQQGLLNSEPSPADSQSIARYLTILQDQCNQELKLVNDLLDMRAIDSDAYPLDLTPIQLSDWIPHIADSFQERAAAQQQRWQIDLTPNLSPFVTDLSGLTRILSELFNNACKYTPVGEQIVVTAQPWLTASSTSGIQISVSNSGVEIAPEELSRIFNPFYRIPNSDPWRRGGTGLGLALTRKLVNWLQGRIEVTSTRGWTTFAVKLPNLRMDSLGGEYDGDEQDPTSS